MDLSKSHIELVQEVYKNLESKISDFKTRKDSSLTLAEKVLYGHAKDVKNISLNRGKDFGDFLPDRVAMQDATAQMALLQFMQAGKEAKEEMNKSAKKATTPKQTPTAETEISE